ncbi:MAG: aminopeptidase [Myxococcales bacterium]
MLDPRAQKLAALLVNYSCAVQPGENVLLEASDVPDEFVAAVVRAIAEAGGRPFVLRKSVAVNRALMWFGSEEQWQLIADLERAQMEKMQCYIGARGNLNVSELSDVPTEKQKIYEKTVWQQVHHEVRVKKTRWVVLRWPNPAMAQLAEMSTEAFEDFYFDVCTLDYAKMSRAMRPLQALMQRTDRVRLIGPGTDLRFSIRDIPAVCCDGKVNIPDGEVFTAPVRDSLQGTIQFNSPTIYRGVTHHDVRLVFRDGAIVEASSSDTKALNTVLDSDAGARHVGEFAIGFNPYCVRPMKDILFDEKISGSIHLTPGACYDEASNGNQSSIHWDLVLRQSADAGGGELWFDDVLIRKDGLFVVPELNGLNPDQLR